MIRIPRTKERMTNPEDYQIEFSGNTSTGSEITFVGGTATPTNGWLPGEPLTAEKLNSWLPQGIAPGHTHTVANIEDIQLGGRSLSPSIDGSAILERIDNLEKQ